MPTRLYFLCFVIIVNLTVGYFPLPLLYSHRPRLKNKIIILDGVCNKLLICKAVFSFGMFSVDSHVLDGDTSITKDLHMPNMIFSFPLHFNISNHFLVEWWSLCKFPLPFYLRSIWLPWIQKTITNKHIVRDTQIAKDLGIPYFLAFLVFSLLEWPLSL